MKLRLSTSNISLKISLLLSLVGLSAGAVLALPSLDAPAAKPKSPAAVTPVAAAAPAPVAKADPAGVEFFEKKVRPVLAQQCYKCHSATSEKLKGGLRLDARDLMLKGGESGPAIVPGDPAHSLLIKAVRYEDKDTQMPPKTKLPPQAVADLGRWVEMGAPWPAEAVAAAPVAKAGGGYGADYDKLRKEHWAWQPVKAAQPPAVRDAAWPLCDVDRFVLAKLEDKGLKPVAEADKAALVPAGLLRPDRPAADAGRGRGVRERQSPRRLREAGRQAARFQAVRRALGPALAGRRPLRRIDRLGPQRPLFLRLAVPRLRHRLVQQRQAVRPVRPRAGRRRFDAGFDAGASTTSNSSPPVSWRWG